VAGQTQLSLLWLVGQLPRQAAFAYRSGMAAVELATLEDQIARVTLNRPERLNAIDGSLINAMDDALDALSGGQFRAAILTGAGRGFCAGADLSGTGEAWTNPPAESPAFKVNYDAQVRLADQYTRLYELPIPVIAAVNGVAVGGGLAFALHCDIRIASDQARFGSVFIKAGFSSMDMGTSYLLPKIVGAGVARELMLTGRIIDAAEAYRIKLVHEVVPPDELMTAALNMARSIVANNAYGVWQTKIGLNTALDAPSLRHAKEIENRTQILSGFTNNPVEAAKAHQEKRAPVWDPL
jgi:enoyl-CoA hydratase/carnithine racemase